MPLLNQPLSLETICVDEIVEEKLDEIAEEYLKYGTQEPWDYINVFIRNKIFLHKKLPKTYSILNLLLGNHTEVLNLEATDLPFTLRDKIVNLVKSRCFCILSLNLRKSNYCSSHLPLFAKTQMNLVKLDVSCTEANDSLMCAIATNLRHLEYLNLKETSITDAGVLHFDVQFGLCPKIRELIITDTGVTIYGVSNLLDYLPKIEILDHELMIFALDHLVNLHANYQIPMNLKAVTASCNHYDDENISFMKKLENTVCNLSQRPEVMPQIKILEFNLDLAPVTETLGKRISQFSSITVLRLTKVQHFIDFMIPILGTIGSQLEELCLFELRSQALLAILRTCPNLKVLKVTRYAETAMTAFAHMVSVSNGMGYGSDVAQIYRRLDKLEHLYLKGYNQMDMNSDIVVDFLASPCIKTITLHKCSIITDPVIEAILGPFGTNFASLKSLELNQCNYLTHRCIEELALSPDNSLESITVHYCQHITSRHIERIKNRTREQNIKLKWDTW